LIHDSTIFKGLRAPLNDRGSTRYDAPERQGLYAPAGGHRMEPLRWMPGTRLSRGDPSVI
jgi:hypothetical protein